MPRKKQKGNLKPGHSYYKPYSKNREPETAASSWGRRLAQDEFDRVAKPSACGSYYTVTGADGEYGTANLLRPKKEAAEEITQQYLRRDGESVGSAEMKLFHQGKLCSMWNQAITEHMLFEGKCDYPHFEVGFEQQRGLCWRQSLKCKNCQYQGVTHNLYTEVPSTSPGPRAAAPNLGWHVGLQETTVGVSKSRLLLTGAHMPPPSKSAMSKCAAKVADATSGMVEQSLKRERRQLLETNKARGLPVDAGINISVDGRYNSTVIASRKKAGQNASQAVGIAIEQQTAKKKIVAAHMESKLCWRGSWLRNRGFDADCPGGHEGCTASLSRTEPLSEYRIGEQLGQRFVEDGVKVQFVTTDGDARSAEGVAVAMSKLFPEHHVERKADPIHLSQSLVRQTRSATFSQRMFPGNTKEERKQQQQALALDLADRSHAIFSTMWQDYAGNIERIARRMPSVISATVNCYGGDCNQCRKRAVVCDGGMRKSWWKKSFRLTTGVLRPRSLCMSVSDRALMRELLHIRLGEAALTLLDRYSNTCKNEAVNRSLSASLPKNVNFSRTGKGRMLATCHRVNEGIGNSFLMKMEYVGAPVPRCSRPAQALRRMQEEETYRREYRKRAAVIKRRVTAKYRQYREHTAAKKSKAGKAEKTERYLKCQLDPRLNRKRLSAQQRLQTEQRKRLRDALANTRKTERHSQPQSRRTRLEHNYAYNYADKTDHTYVRD